MSLDQMRIAVISDPDDVWSLSAWEKTIPDLLADGHKVVSIWTCPAILGKHRGRQIALWYLRTFGFSDFVKLGLFAALAKFARILRGRALSFRALAKKHSATYDECSTPNDPRFIGWLQSQQIDILLISVGFILGERVIAAPRLGTINKHAAALPANRGLFPYFWARLHGTPQGVSYYVVTRGVDEGPLLVQNRIIPTPALASMVRFYLHVFRTFPHHMREAVTALAKGETIQLETDIVPSYYGLPTRHDVAIFKKRGGHVVTLSDVPKALSL
jgi:folate-dependent phosphoribosylglycinamide formyltransferase PurN